MKIEWTDGIDEPSFVAVCDWGGRPHHFRPHQPAAPSFSLTKWVGRVLRLRQDRRGHRAPVAIETVIRMCGNCHTAFVPRTTGWRPTYFCSPRCSYLGGLARHARNKRRYRLEGRLRPGRPGRRLSAKSRSTCKQCGLPLPRGRTVFHDSRCKWVWFSDRKRTTDMLIGGTGLSIDEIPEDLIEIAKLRREISKEVKKSW